MEQRKERRGSGGLREGLVDGTCRRTTGPAAAEKGLVWMTNALLLDEALPGFLGLRHQTPRLPAAPRNTLPSHGLSPNARCPPQTTPTN